MPFLFSNSLFKGTPSCKGRVLLVAATYHEVKLLMDFSVKNHKPPEAGKPFAVAGTDLDILITGPGITATVYFLTRVLSSSDYSVAINAGITGSYNDKLKHGALVMVERDRFSDIGAESTEGFIPGEMLPFRTFNSFPFVNGWLIPDTDALNVPPGIISCCAVTSDTVHTRPETIRRISALYQPDIESMEGAAFFYVCMQMDIPCLQFRSVSNMVGPRNDVNWNISSAIENLNQFLFSYFNLNGQNI